MKLPLCSSQQVCNALARLGAEPRGKAKGSHQAFVRYVDGERHVCIVPLGKTEIPRGTLESILRQAGITAKQFREALK